MLLFFRLVFLLVFSPPSLHLSVISPFVNHPFPSPPPFFIFSPLLSLLIFPSGYLSLPPPSTSFISFPLLIFLLFFHKSSFQSSLPSSSTSSPLLLTLILFILIFLLLSLLFFLLLRLFLVQSENRNIRKSKKIFRGRKT